MLGVPPWEGWVMVIDGGVPQMRSIRSAVFVDFDNVYSGLQRLDPNAAETFATDPLNWLAALATGTDHIGPFGRRFLICNCYLNPGAYSRFRPFYTRAGFRVIDCPSLTQQGKSSADINLVLDVVDALDSATRYDEFVLLSADADFTPLALRLRAQDRRVTVVLAGPAASAYKSVADHVVEPDAFAQQLAVSVVTAIGQAAEDDETSAVSPPAVEFGVPLDKEVEETPQPTLLDAGQLAEVDDGGAQAAVMALLEASRGPLAGPRVAQSALTACPGLRESQWRGYRTFATWLTNRVPIAGQATEGPWHFVWDAQRFTEADIPRTVGTIVQVSGVTDTPPLTEEQYATLLSALAEDVNAYPFDRTQTSKRVRDACQAAGAPVGRNAVNYVIQGLVFAGVRLAAPVEREHLASAWADNVIGLCRGARMELDDATEAEIRRWVSGGLAGPV